MTNPGSDKPDKTPDLGAAAKQFWGAVKAKAKEVGQKATETAKDLQAKARQGQAASVQPESPSQTGQESGSGTTTPVSAGAPFQNWLKSPKTIGCLGIVAILAICGGLLEFFGFVGPKITLDGNDVVVRYSLSTRDYGSLWHATNNLSKAVYKAANKYKSTDRVRVVFWIKDMASDRYGKSVSLDEEMGRFELDASEVRKYVDEDTFFSRNELRLKRAIREAIEQPKYVGMYRDWMKE